MRKVLSIDFDGVLHDVDVVVLQGCGTETKVVGARLWEWVPILHACIRPYDVDLVIHSSWRHDSGRKEILAALPEYLRERVTGIVPFGPRQAAIVECMSSCGIADYRALDASLNEFPPGWPPLIPCQSDQGVSDPLVQRQVQACLREI